MSWTIVKTEYNGNGAFPKELPEHQILRRVTRVEGKDLHSSFTEYPFLHHSLLLEISFKS